MNKTLYIALIAASAAVMVGCGGGTSGPVTATEVVPKVKPITFKPDAPAGLPVSQPESIDTIEASGRSYRQNLLLLAARFPLMQVPAKAFDLRPAERDYEARQAMERYYASNGSFAVTYVEPVPVAAQQVFEPQPYRRLSGIVIGDAVMALIEMGDGRTELVRPGMKIPNSEWTVVSIDEERAVLRRGGNKLPKQIVVRLESAPPGVGPNANQGGGRPNGPPGGFGGPGGPPGGFGPGGGPPSAGGPGRGGKGGSD